MNMDIEDEDDLYAPEEPKVETDDKKNQAQQPSKSDDLEEGEEEDEGAAMDEDDDSDDSVGRHPYTCVIELTAPPGH